MLSTLKYENETNKSDLVESRIENGCSYLSHPGISVHAESLSSVLSCGSFLPFLTDPSVWSSETSSGAV